MALSLVSLNIERDLHFPRFIPFLLERKADVVCFQELFERDIPRITELLGGQIRFVPFMKYENNEPIGIGVWTALPIRDLFERQYAGHTDTELRLFLEDVSPQEKYDSIKDILLVADIEKDGEVYRIATTHFVWTPDGQANEYQLTAADSLVHELASVGEYVLCGDFNAPRGREAFGKFSAFLKDAVPAQYETSLDKDLHKAGYLPYMVDVMFTTPAYEASDVSLQFGVSDHAAVVATITKNASL